MEEAVKEVEVVLGRNEGEWWGTGRAVVAVAEKAALVGEAEFVVCYGRWDRSD